MVLPIICILVDPFVTIMSFSAGLGVLSMAVQAVKRMAQNSGASVKNPFFLLDKDVWPYPFLHVCAFLL